MKEFGAGLADFSRSYKLPELAPERIARAWICVLSLLHDAELSSGGVVFGSLGLFNVQGDRLELSAKVPTTIGGATKIPVTLVFEVMVGEIPGIPVELKGGDSRELAGVVFAEVAGGVLILRQSPYPAD
jgi:hypothetical protein